MKVSAVRQFIQNARKNPVELWPGYEFAAIPFAIFDDHAVEYVNHSSPPTDRPENLMAATAVEIGEVSTATIPAQFCESEEKTVTLAYHEGFHVYQHHNFASGESYNLFLAMASYPQLDVEFRAICCMEVDILNADLSVMEKLQHLKPLAKRRRDFFSGNADLLAYEHMLERSEGTAFYVEQLTGQSLFGLDIPPVAMVVGWARFYQVGAALCHLYDEVFPDWHQAIMAGHSLTDLLLERITSDAEIDSAVFDSAYQAEKESVAAIQADVDAAVQKIQANGVLRIRYPVGKTIYRGFNPSTMISLNNGRMLHRDMYQFMLPEGGSLRFQGVSVIDDVANGEVQFGLCPVTLNDGVLQIETDAINGTLPGISDCGEGVFCIS